MDTKEQLEIEIVERVIAAILDSDQKYTIAVYDGEAIECTPTRDKDRLAQALFSTEETTFLIFKNDPPERLNCGFILFVPGLGSEIIADHSASMSAILEPIFNYIDEI